MNFSIHTSVFLLLSTTFVIASGLESNAPEDPQSLTSIICNSRSDGRSSCEVELDVPASCVDASGSSSCPIVFFLHGSGGTNQWFKKQSGVHGEGLIGVYPQGEGGWNTGPKDTNKCAWDDFGCTTDPDEGDYIASIIAEIRNQGADGNVYVIGNSNGAALAHRLAANAGNDLPIKGIVTKVTQLLASPERSGPGILNYNQPSSAGPPVSVMSVMGTADGLIPYEGGSSAVFGGDEAFQLMHTLDSMQVWATHNGCSGSNSEATLTSDMGTGIATKYDYSDCPEGVVVEHYAIEGGGHNAGGVAIAGEKVDYVLAYDFIRRVENASPTAPSPVAAPVAAPTPDSCTNDPTWAGKFNAAHTCDFIAQNPVSRCFFENTQGISAEEACPEACNTDCTAPAPVVAPVEAPSPSSCANDPTWAGKFNASHTCDFVSQNPENRCFFENSQGVKAEDACPGACNSECTVTSGGIGGRRRLLRRRRN